ncbi:MAG: type IV pilus assembly protein PilF [Candidatus Azotimanducaceae bacterium]|jgi:type IV pilus assembly protein PilF
MKISLLITVTMLLLSGCVTQSQQSGRQVANDDDQVQALVELGVGYIRNQQYPRAKENLSRALKIDPDSAIVHNLFGLVFQLEGEVDSADDFFRRSLKLDPSFSMARNNYGAFLYEQGRYIEAVEQLELCTEDRLYGSRAQVFENLAVSYLKLDRVAEADVALVRSLQLNPGQARAALELAALRFDQQSYLEARQLLSRHGKVRQPSARSLWLGIQLARIFNKSDDEASQALALKNIFPTSQEYQLYQDSIRNL